MTRSRCGHRDTRHVHYRLNARKFCRLECVRCRRVLDEGPTRASIDAYELAHKEEHGG